MLLTRSPSGDRRLQEPLTKILYKKTNFKKSGLFNNGFYGQDIVIAFSPPEYCRLFAQKKAYQGGVTGTPGPPLDTPLKAEFFMRLTKL